MCTHITSFTAVALLTFELHVCTCTSSVRMYDLKFL